MSYRNPELTEKLLPLIKKELEGQIFTNTKRLRKKFNCTGKRITIILRRLGWVWYSQASNYQVYTKEVEQ